MYVTPLKNIFDAQFYAKYSWSFFCNLSSLNLGIEICQDSIHPNMVRAKVKIRIIMEQL